MAALSGTLGSPLSSPQIEPLDAHRHNGRLASPETFSTFDTTFPLPSPLRRSSNQFRERELKTKDISNNPQLSLFQLLQKQNQLSNRSDSEDEEEQRRRRSSAFGLGLFRELPEEDKLEQLKAQEDFAFECPACGKDDVNFWSRGRTAGQAECQNKSCGHRWMWKPTTKMIKDGVAFEPNMALPPKPAARPPAKKRKTQNMEMEMEPPAYRGTNGSQTYHSSYYSKPRRRIPPEVSLEHQLNEPDVSYDRMSMRDADFYERYERFFGRRESVYNGNNDESSIFPATKFPEPTEKPGMQSTREAVPIDEEDEIYEAELLELELRRRELEARREAHRARKSQLLLQQRREQLREQNRANRPASRDTMSPDSHSPAVRALSSSPKAPALEKQASSSSHFSQEYADNSAIAPAEPNFVGITRGPNEKIHTQASAAEDNSDFHMFSDEEDALQKPGNQSQYRTGKIPARDSKAVKPVIQVEGTMDTDERDIETAFAEDDMLGSADVMDEEYGYYFSDEDQDFDKGASATLPEVRKQKPVWHHVSDEELEGSDLPWEDDDEYMEADFDQGNGHNEGVSGINGVSENRTGANMTLTKPGGKKRGRKPGSKNKNPSKASERKMKAGKVKGSRQGTGKKPMNSFNPYLLFNKEMRPKLVAEMETKSTGDVSRALSEAWKNMSQHDKQKYIDEAKRKRAELGIDDDKRQEERDQALQRLKERRSEEAGRQKGIPNPFFLWSAEERPKVKLEYPNLGSLTELNDILSKRWKSLDEDVRKVYFDQYKKHKEELLKENPHFKRRRRRKSEVQKASAKMLNNNNTTEEQ
ncbi:hypothetical protein NQZ79_g8064 [Umbelopsis isabellina]|nr:hypothetical protein NQZ79_g8064 [Umbelopsis isabellina]